jgi:hypothetical protein
VRAHSHLQLRRLATLTALSVLMMTAAGRAQDLPAGGVPFLRVDGGVLDPDSPAKGVPALGLTAGWSPSGPNAVVIRYLRQSRSTNGGVYLVHPRGFFLVQWEHALGYGEVYRRQFSTRVGFGVMSRYQDPVAGVLSGGIVMHYPVTPRLALTMSLEDNIGVLPHRDGVGCYSTGTGTFCPIPPSGGWQHNFGILAAVEWWPTTRRFLPRLTRTASPEELTSTVPVQAVASGGALCRGLPVGSDTLVRINTYERGPNDVLVSRHGSEVGPVIQCDANGLVLGPSPGQSAPELVILAPWVREVWVRGDRRATGALVGTGAGAALGLAFGLAKSYLCAGAPCAKHQGLSTVIGAATGGAIGWFLGRATPRWVRRYP